MQKPKEDPQRVAGVRLSRIALTRRRLLRGLWNLSLYTAACTAGRMVLGPGLPSRAEGVDGSVTGRVTDLVTGRPLAGVRLSAAGILAETDRDGHYTLCLPPGIYVVRATHPGYLLRVGGFILATIALFGWSFAGTRMLLRQDGLARREVETQPALPHPEARDQLAQLLVESKLRVLEVDRVDGVARHGNADSHSGDQLLGSIADDRGHPLARTFIGLHPVEVDEPDCRARRVLVRHHRLQAGRAHVGHVLEGERAFAIVPFGARSK